MQDQTGTYLFVCERLATRLHNILFPDDLEVRKPPSWIPPLILRLGREQKAHAYLSRVGIISDSFGRDSTACIFAQSSFLPLLCDRRKTCPPRSNRIKREPPNQRIWRERETYRSGRSSNCVLIYNAGLARTLSALS